MATPRKKPEERLKTGRPSKYREEFALQALKLCRLGATDKELADFFQGWNGNEDEWLSFCLLLIREDRFGKREKESKARSLSRKMAMVKSPSLRIRNSVSARLWSALKGKTDKKLFSKLKYTPSELVLHLESQFKDGMSWDNYGSKWHVDHIKPCSLFDHADPMQFDECWALSNLQPLWASENIKKGAKYVCS